MYNKRIIVSSEDNMDRVPVSFELEPRTNGLLSAVQNSIDFLTGCTLSRSEIMDDMITFCGTSNTTAFQLDGYDCSYKVLIQLSNVRLKIKKEVLLSMLESVKDICGKLDISYSLLDEPMESMDTNDFREILLNIIYDITFKTVMHYYSTDKAFSSIDSSSVNSLVARTIFSDGIITLFDNLQTGDQLEYRIQARLKNLEFIDVTHEVKTPTEQKIKTLEDKVDMILDRMGLDD